MTKGEKIINKVKDVFTEVREKYPEITNEKLEENGAIHYMNERNGTDFDWHANGHTSGLMVFHKSGRGFIKLIVCSDGKIIAWVFPDGDMLPKEEFEREITKEEALYLAVLLYYQADLKFINNKPIEKINFSYEPTSTDFEMFCKYCKPRNC